MPTRNQAIAALVAVPLLLVSGCSTAIDQELSQTTRLADPLLPVQEDTATPAETSSPAVKSPEEVTQEPSVEPTEKASAPTTTAEPEPDVSPEPQEAPEPEPTEPEPVAPSIADIAYAYLDGFRDNSASVPEGMVLTADNLPEFHIEPLYSVTKDAMSMFDEQYSLPMNYKLIAFTESDFEWADQKLVEYNGQLPDGSWGQAWINTRQAEGHCWMAINSNGNTHFCMATNPRTAAQQYNTVAHEYFHNIQMGPLGMSPVRTPIWITEGGAEYFGWAITDRGSRYTLNKLAGWQTRYLSETYGGRGFKDYINNMSESDFVAGMKAMEVGSIDPTSRDAGQRFAMYKLGAAANEYLVGKYSYSTYMSYLEAIGNGGQQWATAFSSYFGLTPAEFYSDFYNYLDSVY